MKQKNRTTKVIAILSVVLTFIFVGVVFAAPVTVDAFNDGTQNLTADPDTTSVNGVVDHASILGGERDAVLNWVSGSGEARLEIDRFDSNLLSFSLGSGIAGNATISWDGNDDDATTLAHTGLGGEDLIDSSPANTAFLLTVVNNDNALNLILRVYTNSTDFSTNTVPLPGGIAVGNQVDFVIPFSSFTDSGGGATFSNVGAIEMVINSTNVADADVSIDLFEATAASHDFGDVPASYEGAGPDPARHILESGLRLGPSVSAEDGKRGTTAIEDTFDDGVVRTSNWVAGNPASLGITVSGCTASCRLNGWVDWDGDGNFTTVDDQIFNDVAVTNGTTSLNFTVPAGADVTDNSLYARFRICSLPACNMPVGQSANGEVEDYFWGFGPTAITLTNATADNQATGLILVLGLTAAGLIVTTLLLRRRQEVPVKE